MLVNKLQRKRLFLRMGKTSALCKPAHTSIWDGKEWDVAGPQQAKITLAVLVMA